MDNLSVLKALVDIYSPIGSEGITALADHLVSVAGELGLDAYIDEQGNFVAERGSGRPHILLVGHIDTVRGEIPVRVENGHLFGRGQRMPKAHSLPCS